MIINFKTLGDTLWMNYEFNRIYFVEIYHTYKNGDVKIVS